MICVDSWCRRADRHCPGARIQSNMVGQDVKLRRLRGVKDGPLACGLVQLSGQMDGGLRTAASCKGRSHWESEEGLGPVRVAYGDDESERCLPMMIRRAFRLAIASPYTALEGNSRYIDPYPQRVRIRMLAR